MRPVVVDHRPRPVYHPLIPLYLRHNLPLHLQRRQGNLEVRLDDFANLIRGSCPIHLSSLAQETASFAPSDHVEEI